MSRKSYVCRKKNIFATHACTTVPNIGTTVLSPCVTVSSIPIAVPSAGATITVPDFQATVIFTLLGKCGLWNFWRSLLHAML